jgi:four helix bundle protein
LCHSLPNEWDVREIGKQLLRSGTSVASNYRASNRARSAKEFCSKIGLVLEEADESQLWLELLPEAHPKLDASVHAALLSEASQLTAIFTKSHQTSKANLERQKAEKNRRRTTRT